MTTLVIVRHAGPRDKKTRIKVVDTRDHNVVKRQVEISPGEEFQEWIHDTQGFMITEGSVIPEEPQLAAEEETAKPETASTQGE